ncbi:MAG: response regulator [Candidatus Methylomirabilales bacterium]
MHTCPQNTAANAPGATSGAHVTTEARPQRILIAEDEGVTSLRIAGIVEALGCTVVGPAASPREALNYLESSDVDGAVLDVNLNGQPVYAVADRLALRKVPFFFLTGYGSAAIPPAHADRCVVQKPFSSAELARALTDELGVAPPRRVA